MAYQSKVLVFWSEEWYNKLATKYKSFHQHLDGFDNGLFRRFIPRDLSWKNILDLGAGDGRIYKFFDGKNFEKYVALDIAKNLLEEHPDWKKIETIIGDLNQNLNLEDKNFDIITSFFVLEHLRELDNLFSEIYRILKSGGTWIIWHFIQRREMVFKDGKEQFKIQQYKRKKEEIIDIAENNFFKIQIQEVIEKWVLLGRIFVFEK